FGGAFFIHSSVPASGPDQGPVPDDWGSASHGLDPAAADPASGRHPPAVGRASYPGSGSAVPGCSDWSLRDLRCSVTVRVNRGPERLLQRNIGSAAIIA